LMIDLSRKYYSIQWLENHIRELSYLKMNLFHLHLSDNEGFRMECSTYPQIQSEQRYSKAELKNLIELASSYNIEIIPEIDMPNHMSAIMKNFPDAWLIDSLGNNLGECCMDFTLDTARKVASNILDEYLPLFPGRYWHMGADEYITNFDLFPHIIKWVKQKYGENAQPQEAYFDFINWIDSTVKSYGKTLRTWNDWSDNTADLTFTTSVNKDVVIDHWQGNFPPQRFIDEGYRINNCSQRHMYYFVANPSINNPLIYEEWTPLLFSKYVNVENKNNKVQGAKIAVWSDLPDTETETQTAKAILKVLRIVAQKTWNFNDSPLEYKDFESEINQIGVAPLIQYPENPIPNNLAYLKPIYASSVESNSDEFSSEMANDGDYYTRWASHLTDKEWIYIDFGEIIEFTRVKLRWEYAYATQYALQISNDADNWTDIYETFNGNGEVDDITTLKSKARYLKLDFRKRVAWNGYSLWEIEVYDSSKINSSYSETLSSFGNISPNPATDYITIIQPSDGFLVEIYDVMGVLIQSTKFNLTQHPPLMGERLRIDVANLFPGVYFVKIGDRFEKFVKI